MLSDVLASQNISGFTITLVTVGVGLGFFAQTIVGFTAGAIAFPIILVAVSIQDANAIFSILLIIFSIIMVYQCWHDMDKAVIGDLLIGMVIGLILGIILLKHVHPLILNKLLGIVTVCYAIYATIKQKNIPGITRLGWLFGFVGGLLSGLFSTGSPAQVMYISNRLHSGKIIRATAIGLFAIGNFLRVPFLWYEGILTSRTILLSAISLPAFFLALYAGHKLFHKLDDKIFKNVIIGFLALAGILLILK